MTVSVLAASVYEAGGPFELETLRLDSPREDEVLVQVHAAGICQTDLSARAQHLPFPLPGVLGHEGAGVVVEVGAAVMSVRVGDRVVMSQAFCGVCPECEVGHTNACERSTRLAFSGRRGDGSSMLQNEQGVEISGAFLGQSSLGTFALARAVNVFKVPDDVPFEVVAPMACGVQTGVGAVLNLLQPDGGTSLAVFGAGTVGLSALMAAVDSGCEPIVVVDINNDRLALSKELGATHVV